MELTLRTEFIRSKAASRAAGVAVFAILTMLGAFVRIPVPGSPVPLTLQTFFVLLSGACLGRRMGALSQVCYVLVGIAGLPVFSQAGSGIPYLAGPTGGYLAGFIAASLWVGPAAQRVKTRTGLFLLFCCGTMLILCCGTLWLSFLLRYPPLEALYSGFLIFIPGDAAKAYAAACVYHMIQKRCKQLF
jgi:biotin transport system substrate-specific component